MRAAHWSLDACVGYARLHGLFKEDELVCTKTLYNELWAGRLDLTLFELPEALKRKRNKGKNRPNKRILGDSIELRPEIAAKREEEGHWEGDTVVGLRSGKEAVVLALIEKKTENYLAIRIPGKTSGAVMAAMKVLREEYGDRFGQVFKTITVDNGSEFSDFAELAQWARRSTSPTRIPRGNGLRMNGTMACSGGISQKEPPLRSTQTKESLCLLMN